jgi:hypothetical protein
MFRRPLPEVTFEENDTSEVPVRTSQEATTGSP